MQDLCKINEKKECKMNIAGLALLQFQNKYNIRGERRSQGPLQKKIQNKMTKSKSEELLSHIKQCFQIVGVNRQRVDSTNYPLSDILQSYHNLLQ